MAGLHPFSLCGSAVLLTSLTLSSSMPVSAAAWGQGISPVRDGLGLQTPDLGFSRYEWLEAMVLLQTENKSKFLVGSGKSLDLEVK